MRQLLWAAFVFVSTAALGQEFTLGAQVGDFSVHDSSGQAVSFSKLKGDVTVVVFTSVQCPVSNAYNERMNALYADYAPKGVHFVFLNANNNETADAVEAHARAHSFAFTVYKDDASVVADRFGAQVTPETWVIDRTGTIRYHGAIDDSQNAARIQHQWLRQALDAVMAGQAPEKAETKAFGCSIKRAKRS